jgi:AraC family transcriptional regulator, alkane utilization regulator
MDALSDVLRAVRLSGAVYLNGEFGAPWSVEGPADAALCAAFLPSARNVVTFHLITEGSCLAQLADEVGDVLELSAGDLLVVPRGEIHVMASERDLLRTRSARLSAEQLDSTPGEMIRLSHGGSGAKTRVVCGFLACDEVLGNPLLASLPRIFKVGMRSASGSAWLESSLRFAVEEVAVARPGGVTVLAKLSELLFVEAVRRCIDTLPENEKNWLAGLRDRFVGRALSLMHGQPAHAWTVDELARKVGLSRSALAQRFTDFLGQPPMQYLARWRLQIAAQKLREGEKSLADVAEHVGYESEAAFNRAFKREFGLPPASWRRNESANKGLRPEAGA